eukprot:731111-Alexandrium_andersonii.AAC.1
MERRVCKHPRPAGQPRQALVLRHQTCRSSGPVCCSPGAHMAAADCPGHPAHHAQAQGAIR